jgi:hypothetical protein
MVASKANETNTDLDEDTLFSSTFDLTINHLIIEFDSN